jgi:hypothetical protein
MKVSTTFWKTRTGLDGTVRHPGNHLAIEGVSADDYVIPFMVETTNLSENPTDFYENSQFSTGYWNHWQIEAPEKSTLTGHFQVYWYSREDNSFKKYVYTQKNYSRFSDKLSTNGTFRSYGYFVLDETAQNFVRTWTTTNRNGIGILIHVVPASLLTTYATDSKDWYDATVERVGIEYTYTAERLLFNFEIGMHYFAVNPGEGDTEEPFIVKFHTEHSSI